MEEKNTKPTSGARKKRSNNADKPRAYTSKIENKSPWKLRPMAEMFSIKLKLTLSHTLILMIPVIIIVLLFYSYSKAAILQEVEKANIALSTQVTNLVNLKLEEIDTASIILISDQAVLDVVRKSLDDYENFFYMNKDREDKLFSLITSLKSSERNLKSVIFINDLEVIDPDRTDFLFTEDFLKSFKSSDNYKQIIDNKSNPVWFYDLFGNGDLYFARNVRNIYAVTGETVLLIAVKADYLMNELDTLQHVEGSRMSIVDKEGNIVVSSDTELVMGDTLPISDEIKTEANTSLVISKDTKPIANGTFITEKNVDAETMVIFKETLAGWYYVAEIPTASIYGGINKMAMLAFAIVFICLFIGLIIGRILAITITKPIDYIRSLMKLVEKGDFTVRSRHKGRHDLGQLSYSFNAMTENTANLIKEMSNLSFEVAQDAEELQKIAGQSALASKEVIEAVELLSEGAMEQAQDADNTAKVIKELVNQINKTEESFNAVVKVTNRTKRASSEATQIIEELSAATTQSANLSNSIKSDMGMLAKQFKEILGIISMINAISAQTNLLALNAAIEAARAGDAGKGFAVVADEIRKLASQSKEAAKCISDIVNSIYKATNETVGKIESGAYIYEQQEEAVKNTEETFMEIISDMDNIIHEVDNMYVLIAGLEEIQGTALESITSIAVIAEQSASAIEEVLATTEEQTSSAQYLSDMSTKLYDVIDTMTVNVKKYIVSKNQ